MKKIYTYILMTLALAIGSFGLIACGETQDELDTSQLGSGRVALKSFGPSPVLRGGILRFIGDNMNKVTGVVLPGTAEVTEIEVISNSEIHITVPQDAQVGVVTLNTPNGEIVTQTPLTYSEPVVFSSVSPTSVKPGDVITITGDYLNLMKEVIFTDNVVVTQFDSQTRKQLTLRVPVAARSGQVILSDGAETPNWLYSKESLTVAIPTYTKSSTEQLKAGSALVITGENLDWIASVRFMGAEVLKTDDGGKGFTVSADAKTLTVNLPATATAGAVTLVAYSGVEIAAGTVTPVEPTELSAAPVPVKNGADLTISGKDLDLIVSVTFPNVGAAATIVSASATQIVATVDATAQDGDVTLTMANGVAVTVPFTTLKPTVMAYDPPALTAGDEVTVTGTDLDLVAAVLFAGEGAPTVTLTDENRLSETSLKFNVPSVAETCAPQLKLINGMTVDTDITLDIAPATDPVIATMPVNTTPGSMITITGKNLNFVDAFYLGDTKITVFEDRTATSVTFEVPAADPLAYHIKMVNYQGQEFLSTATIQLLKVLWTGSIGPCDWSGAHTVTVDPADLVVGYTLGIDFECDPSQTYWQLRFCSGWWGAIPSAQAPNADNLWEFAATETNFEYALTQADVDIIVAQGNILLFVGNGCVIKRVYTYK
jgi:hypothetical protein